MNICQLFLKNQLRNRLLEIFKIITNQNNKVNIANGFNIYETQLGLIQDGNVQYTVLGSDCPEHGEDGYCCRPTPNFSGFCSRTLSLLPG